MELCVALANLGLLGWSAGLVRAATVDHEKTFCRKTIDQSIALAARQIVEAGINPVSSKRFLRRQIRRAQSESSRCCQSISLFGFRCIVLQVLGLLVLAVGDEPLLSLIIASGVLQNTLLWWFIRLRPRSPAQRTTSPIFEQLTNVVQKISLGEPTDTPLLKKLESLEMTSGRTQKYEKMTTLNEYCEKIWTMQKLRRLRWENIRVLFELGSMGAGILPILGRFGA